MADYSDRRDISAVASFGDSNSLFQFGFEADAQVIINESPNDMYLSWDGVNIHARLRGMQPSSVLSYADHVREKVWVRPVVVGGGAKIVQVLASTR